MPKKKAHTRPAATTVTLVVPQHGLAREFGVEHAERLLTMGSKENGGWVLPESSDFIFDTENGLRFNSNKRNSTETEA